MEVTNTTTATSTTTSLQGTSSSSSSTEALNQTLGQEDFLKLMVAQVQNQDPFAPMENGDFIGQMAQFSSVDGINSMNKSLESMAAAFSHGQNLQSASLVGREVVAPTKSAVLSGGKEVEGEIDLPQTVSSLLVEVKDQYGSVVRSMDMGTQAQGTIPFKWDGKNDSGSQMLDGNYYVTASSVVDGETLNFTTSMAVKVNSVSIGSATEGPQLQLADGSNIGLDKVKQVY